MKRIIISALLIALVITCAGCNDIFEEYEVAIEKKKASSLFSEISNEWLLNGKVVVCNETNVMYWVSDGASNRGIMTMLVNPDGTPMVWNGGGMDEQAE